MKQKFISVLLTVALCAALLCACGKQEIGRAHV